MDIFTFTAREGIDIILSKVVDMGLYAFQLRDVKFKEDYRYYGNKNFSGIGIIKEEALTNLVKTIRGRTLVVSVSDENKKREVDVPENLTAD